MFPLFPVFPVFGGQAEIVLVSSTVSIWHREEMEPMMTCTLASISSKRNLPTATRQTTYEYRALTVTPGLSESSHGMFLVSRRECTREGPPCCRSLTQSTQPSLEEGA